MKRDARTSILLSLYVAALPALAQMGSMTTPPLSNLPASAAGATLAIIGPNSQSVLPGEMIKTMPHQNVTLENAHTHATETYSGVRLLDLLLPAGAPTGKDVHGGALSDYVVATGSDGYKAVLALAEIEPDFHPGQVLVADSMNGKPLDTAQGPFQLIVTEDKHPARSVHNLVKIELKQAQ
ncbi:MAG TPA: molybdopterin-dependent oxidoreductase [Acidobacteriaceae bacterium]